MKKFIKWLAKIFKADITVEKIVYKDKIIYKDKVVEVIKYLPNPDLSDAIKYDGLVEGDFTIEGNLLVTGNLNATGGITCLKLNEINKNK